MLVLSRREAEKVLFPALGITVEVTRVQGKTVRLGIDAPDEIRIVRGELDQFESNAFQPKPLDNLGDPVQIQRCLDAANLAIHLSMNQLNQQLNDQASVALENALQCLEQLEQAVTCQTWEPETALVREASTKYRVAAKPTAPTAAVIADNQHLRLQIANLLTANGFEVIEFEKETALLKYLQTNQQPAAVLAIESAPAEIVSLDNAIEKTGPNFELRIPGISSLRRRRVSFSIDNADSAAPQSHFTGWFDNSETAKEFESMLRSV